jgi:RNA polymerase Rpb2, domain 7
VVEACVSVTPFLLSLFLPALFFFLNPFFVLGQMEAAATMSYGASHILQSRFKQWSDPHTVAICAKCQMLADANEEISFAWCRLCKSREQVRMVDVPFTFLLTMDELFATGISVRIALQESDIPQQPNPNEKWIKIFTPD